jgi:hypothetical protein
MFKAIRRATLYLSIFITLIATICAHLNLFDRAAKVYTYILGFSGALWGITVALTLFCGSLNNLSILKRLLLGISIYAFLFLFYWGVVPDIIITGWGPIPDRMASWGMAGLISIYSLAITGLIIIIISYFVFTNNR